MVTIPAALVELAGNVFTLLLTLLELPSVFKVAKKRKLDAATKFAYTMLFLFMSVAANATAAIDCGFADSYLLMYGKIAAICMQVFYMAVYISFSSKEDKEILPAYIFLFLGYFAYGFALFENAKSCVIFGTKILADLSSKWMSLIMLLLTIYGVASKGKVIFSDRTDPLHLFTCLITITNAGIWIYYGWFISTTINYLIVVTNFLSAGLGVIQIGIFVARKITKKWVDQEIAPVASKKKEIAPVEESEKRSK